MSEPRICTIELRRRSCLEPAIYRCTAMVGDTRSRRIETRLGCQECSWAWALEGGRIEPLSIDAPALEASAGGAT